MIQSVICNIKPSLSGVTKILNIIKKNLNKYLKIPIIIRQTTWLYFFGRNSSNFLDHVPIQTCNPSRVFYVSSQKKIIVIIIGLFWLLISWPDKYDINKYNNSNLH